MKIGAVISATVLSISRSHFDPDVFCPPILSKSDHLNGSRLGIGTWSDTECAGKNEFVE